MYILPVEAKEQADDGWPRRETNDPRHTTFPIEA
jgi:hypothetical protein